jgi:multiple sugar transport system permease protein
VASEARHRRRIRFLKRVGLYAGLVVVVVGFAFPFYWMLTTSIKTRIETINPAKWIFSPTLENLVFVFTKRNFLMYLKNSLLTVASTTLLSLVLALPAAYAFARFRFKGKENLAFTVLSLRMLPAMCVVLPYFLLGRFIGILDTSLILIIVYMSFNIPFAIWMLRGFIEDIPIEIEEAAWLDGCTLTRSLFKLIIPLIGPGVAATAIFIVIQSWNEFALALFLTSFQARTLPTMSTMFLSVTGIVWGEMASVGVLTTLPVLVFSLIIQKYMIRGLTFGAIKG